MAQQIINTGAVANDGTGDPLRTAFTETNNNFTEIYTAGPVDSNVRIVDNTILTLNTNGNLVLAPNGIGRVVANVDIVPNTANVRNLGGSAKRWSTVYTQYLDVSGTAVIANADITVGVGNLHITGGTNGYVLQTDGTGNLTWTAQTGGSGNGTPGGANTQIQYNDAGAFGGSAGFTFDKTSNVFTANNVTASTLYSPNFYGNAIMYANTTGYLTNSNLFKYNPDTQTLTVGSVSVAGNVLTGAQVIANGEIQSGTGFFTGGYLSVNGATDLHDTTITGNLSVNLIKSDDSTIVQIQDGVEVDGDAVVNGDVTANTFIGTGNLHLQPDPANAGSYLDIYLTGGPDIHIASNDNSIVIGRDTGANVFVGNDGEVSIRTDNGATPQVWNFDNTGNLILPGNTFAVNYANGDPVIISGGTANTGNVTFSDQIVIGTGISNLVSGLYLAPSSSSANAVQYLRVR